MDETAETSGAHDRLLNALNGTGPSETCPLCGAEFGSKEELAGHSARPHFRTNRTLLRSIGYSAI